MASIAEKITEKRDTRELSAQLRNIVVRDHNLGTLIQKIVRAYA